MKQKILKRVQLWLLLFVLGLGVSLQMVWLVVPEIQWLNGTFGAGTAWSDAYPMLGDWLAVLETSILETYRTYPVIVYCMDYLVFAHIVLIIALLGAVRDPVKNVWVIQFGMIGCGLMIPFTFGMGYLRGIPWFWLCLDSMFVWLGFIVLMMAYRGIKKFR